MRRLLPLLIGLALLAPRLWAQGVATFRMGDIFEMRVSGMPIEEAQQFALQHTIGPDGTVNVPLIGEVKATGLTAPELERTLQKRFVAARIFTQPTVIINPLQGVRMVSIIGGVKKPGRLSWTADLTLISAIGESGGLDEFDHYKGVRIIRDSKVIGIYNLREINKDPTRDQKLLPGDLVSVRE